VSPVGRVVVWEGYQGAGRAPATQAGREPGSGALAGLSLESVCGADPGADPPARPRVSRSAPTSGARPAAPAPAPSPAPEPLSGRRLQSRGGMGTTTQRAERAEVLRGWRAAGARSAGPRARRPRRALSGLGRPRCRPSAPAHRSPAPTQSDWF
jgi:hypothetical protein